MHTLTLETLNMWGGKVFDPLIMHIKEQKEKVDIFCFQEVYHTTATNNDIRHVQEERNAKVFSNNVISRADSLKTIEDQLSDFSKYFYFTQQFEDILNDKSHELYYGLATFVKKKISVEKEGEIYVYRGENTWTPDDHKSLGRNIVYTQFTWEGKKFLVVNLHGLWTGNGKGDTPERIEQSQKVTAFLNEFDGAKILCGDFNLLPDTESMMILEKGMRNLIKEYGVSSTRSHLYEKADKFADYILVSDDVEVKDFRVLEDVVSDHLPLQLEFA